MASKEPETLRSKMAPVPGIMFMFPSKVFSIRLAIQSQTIYLGGASEDTRRKGGVKVPKIFLKSKLPAELKLKVHVFLHRGPLLIHSK